MAIFWFFIRVLIPVTLTGFTVGYLLQFVARERFARLRSGNLEGMAWVEMVKEGTSGVDSKEQVGQLLSDIKTFVSGLGANKRSRGRTSIVWAMEEDKMLHLYIGYSMASGSRGSAKSLEHGLDASILPLDGPPPGLDMTEGVGMTSAWRKDVYPAEGGDKTEVLGSVADNLANLLSTEEARGMIIFTLSPMVPNEIDRLKGHLLRKSVATSGAMRVISSGQNIDNMASQHSTYGTVLAVAETQTLANAVMDRCLGAATTIGQRFSTDNPVSHWSKVTSRWASVSLAVTAVLTLLGITPLLVGLLLIAANVAVAVTVNAPWGEQLAEDLWKKWGSSCDIPSQPVWYLNLRYTIAGKMQSNFRDASPTGDGMQKADGKAHPFGKNTISMHPMPLAETISFPGNLSVNVKQGEVRGRGIPPEMLIGSDEGLSIGTSGTGQEVVYSWPDTSHSIFVCGAPSSGKTNLMHVMYAEYVNAMNQDPTREMSPIWSDTKGDGAYDIWEVAQLHPKARFVDTNNENSLYRLALEGPRNAPTKVILNNCTLLVSSWQASYGDGIMATAREILDTTLKLAMLMPDPMVEALKLEVDPAQRNIIELMYRMIGGDPRFDPWDKYKAMRTRVEAEIAAGKTSDAKQSTLTRMEHIHEALGIMVRYAERRPNDRTQLISSSLNKLTDLRQATHAWQPSEFREDIYPWDLISGFAPVVVNYGSHRLQDDTWDTSVSGTVKQRMLSSYNYIMWRTIQTRCSGWEGMGRRVPMFFDEVADIAVDSQNAADTSNVIAEALKEARSRGAGYILGCQSPTQLPQSTRPAVLGCRTKFWFNLHYDDDMELAASDLSSGDTKSTARYTAADIRYLPDGTCLGIMKRYQSVTPPFSLRVPYLGDVAAKMGAAWSQTSTHVK